MKNILPFSIPTGDFQVIFSEWPLLIVILNLFFFFNIGVLVIIGPIV